MINRHEGCWGLVLFKWRQRFIQIWFCKSGYEIKPHSHPEEDIELMYIFGSTTFFRMPRWSKFYSTFDYMIPEKFTPKWYHIFRTFTVNNGVRHWFKVSKWPLVFINFSTFLPGNKAKSAAIDFKE